MRQIRHANSGASLGTFRQGRSEANQLLRAFRKGDVQAIDRVRAAARASQHVRKALPVNADEEAEINHPHDAVQVIAHEHGGSSWAAMCLETENVNALILDPEHPFISALRENDLAQVRRFLEDDAKLANAKVRGAAWHLAGTVREAGTDGPGKVPEDDQRTTTPLHHASVTGKADLAQLLVEFGADVNGLGFQDNCDISPPIILAAWEGDLETMRVLLEAGADPNLGGNALFTALEHGRRDKAEVLLKHGGTHDIFTASMYGDEGAVKALVKEQPELVHERSPSRDRTPIEEAVNAGQVGTAQILAELGSEILPETAAALGRTDDIGQLIDSEPNALGARYGTQPLLCWAAGARQLEMIDFLIEHGADPNQPDKWKVTPLRKAPTAQVVDHLVRGGADVNLDSRGLTPFAAQMWMGNIDAAEALLRHGADPNQKCSSQGRTAYHWILDRDIDVEGGLRFLLRNGADPSIPDDDGQTPLELAILRGEDEAVRILREAVELTT